MLPADGGGGGAKGSSDLERGVGALKRFQKRVNDLLTELENGAGGTKKVAAQSISRGSFSGANMPFAEADGFFSQYNRVHKALTSLSKSLGDQIEVLRIGVHAADVGFDNVEEDLRSRFHRIQTRLDQEREAHEKRAKPHGDAPGQNADVKDVDTEDMG
ncbi:hypothetical protein ACGF3K_27875 [Streptomyces sp. NPDC047980]|uniref:hypothetical protein n=1 Tax=Streptomyces sp. NPDC047980 TaxID=3365494 RepID=UPI003712CA08